MAKRLLMDLILIVLGLFLVYIVLCFYLYFNQDAYIFFPERTITAIPKTFGMNYEDLFLEAGGEAKINVWHIPNEKRQLIIHCNGNGGNMSDRVEKYALLYSMGFSVIGFDYRGYGKSSGTPSEKGFYEDLRKVVSFAEQKGYNKENIILYGESIGGGVALQIATESRFCALVLESTFTSLDEMARIYYKLFPTKLLLKYRFNNSEKINKINCPVAIMHSQEDEIVPYFMGKKLFEKANEPKIFIELKKGHNDGGIIICPESAKELNNFLHKYQVELKGN
ncbi:MAG: alpha/beta hydrolase [Acidobacteria bacterium]|nr:alpha/beta hydrolase [Acidobacteriota bacterium]